MQVADLATAVGVRDSKDPDGGVIALPPAVWRRLTSQGKSGELDL